MRIWIITLSIFFLISCSTSQKWNDISVSWENQIDGFGITGLTNNIILGFQADAKALVAIDLLGHKISWKANIDAVGFPIPFRQIETDTQNIYAYIPGSGLHIYSLSGELLSKVPAPTTVPSTSSGEFGAGPTLSGTILYLPIHGLLFSYDVSDPKQPKLIWTREFIESSIWALTVDENGSIYVGITNSGSGTIQSLDPDNGQTLWSGNTSLPSNPTNAGTPSALVVIGNKVIAAVLEYSTIQAFDKNNGERIYASESLTGFCPDGSGTIESFEVAESNLYVTPSAGTCVYGINAETGKVFWVHSSQVDPDTSFTYGGTPKYVNGVVYASNSALWALDAKTGKVLAISSNRDDDAIFTNVQYANGEILVWGKNLTAYKPLR